MRSDLITAMSIGSVLSVVAMVRLLRRPWLKTRTKEVDGGPVNLFFVTPDGPRWAGEWATEDEAVDSAQLIAGGIVMRTKKMMVFNYWTSPATLPDETELKAIAKGDISREKKEEA